MLPRAWDETSKSTFAHIVLDDRPCENETRSVANLPPLLVPRDVAIQRLKDIVAIGDALLSIDPNKARGGSIASPMEAMEQSGKLGLQAHDWAYRAGSVLASIFKTPPFASYDLGPPPGGCYPKVELVRNLLTALQPAQPQPPHQIQQSSQQTLAAHDAVTTDRGSGIIFISCGQFTEEERKLGQDLADAVDQLTDFCGYFADRQQCSNIVRQRGRNCHGPGTLAESRRALPRGSGA